MTRHISFLAGALMSLAAVACAQSQPVTGTIIRPGPPQAVAPTQKPTPPAPVARPKGSPPKIEVKEETTQLKAGAETLTFVKREHQLIGQKGLQDASTEWWELRDPAGKVIYRENGGPPKLGEFGDFESTTEVSASSVHADGGDVILVEGMELPSAPNTGTWVQVFGRKWGSTTQPLTSFGPAISTDGEFTGLGVDHRRDLNHLAPGITSIPNHDVLKFRIWTGNFDIEYTALINWITGRVEPAMRCYRGTGQPRIERCSYPIHVDPVREGSELTFVRLFTEPDESMGTPKHVVIKPTSKIEFLEAEVPVKWQVDSKNIFIGVGGFESDDTWVKVRIDGQEGWIHTQEDFLAIGLPQAG